MPKRKILILCRSDLSSDPRVIRQLRALSQDECEVHCIGLKKNEDFNNTFYKIEKRSMPLLRKFFMRVMLLLHVYSPIKFLFDGGIHFYESGKLDTASMPKFDVIIANDLDTLELAAEIKKASTGAKLIYDSHECWTGMYEDQFEWRVTWMGYMKWLSKKLLPYCDKVITVSDGIAGRIQAESGKKPSVIKNAPPFADLAPVNCEDGRIRLIHQGYAHKSRHLELMIEMMDYLDERFTLDMLLISSGSKMSDGYLAYLSELANGNPRINFPPAVSPDEVSDFINKYDIGVYLMPPVNFNHKHALPNKLFQFIQARIAVAVGPSPDMAQIVREHELGVVADDFSPHNLAEKLNSLTSDMIMKYKMNSDIAAKIYNSENEEAKLIELVGSCGNKI